MKTYDTILISAENVSDAKAILRPLLEKKLVIGGMISQGPAMFWWKGEIVEMPYVFATVFGPSGNREAITAVAREHSKEEVPIVLFSEIADSSVEFRTWVDEHLR